MSDPNESELEILREAGMWDFPTPWRDGTCKNLAVDIADCFADYSAWESWMLNRMEIPCSDPSRDQAAGDCDCCNCRIARWWENVEMPERALLYAAMSDVSKHAAEEYGWREHE